MTRWSASPPLAEYSGTHLTLMVQGQVGWPAFSSGLSGRAVLAAMASVLPRGVIAPPGSAKDGLVHMYQTLGGPYGPKPIIDPDSSFDCDNFYCTPTRGLIACRDYPMRICSVQDTLCQGHSICLHKELFPLLQQDLGCLALLFFVAFLAAAPGIGGGGINVPLLMMLGRFDIKEATPLSHIAVMGNSLSQILFNLHIVHPFCKNRPIIHYEVAALVMPMMLGGNSLGVVVGRVFPPTVLIIISLVLLAVASVKTVVKGLKHRRIVMARLAPAMAVSGVVHEAGCTSHADMPLGSPGKGQESTMGSVTQLLSEPAGHPLGLPSSPASEPSSSQATGQVRIPWAVLGFMVGFILLFCVDFIVLAKDVSGVRRCTPVYWVALLGLYPFLGCAIAFAVRRIKDLDRWHRERGDGPIEGDLPITNKTVTVLPALACLVGVFAGLLGLGGGEFVVPLLLEFGFEPRVAAATSGFMVFFTTFSNIIHYMIADTLEPFLGYALGCFFVALLGSFCGMVAGNTQFVKDRSYLVIFVVALLLASSGALLAHRGLAPKQIDWEWQSFCN